MLEMLVRWNPIRSARSALLVLLISQVVLRALMIAIWLSHRPLYISGDEPYYLLMARSFFLSGDFDLTDDYANEAKTGEVYWTLMGQEGTVGPHGIFSVHNIGLPLLLALPFGFGGRLAAQVFMIVITVLVVVMLWKISGLYLTSPVVRLIAVTAVTLSPSMLAGGAQIYPDMPAALLLLYALYRLMTWNPAARWWTNATAGLALAYVPWFQIRFLAPALVLFAAFVVLAIRGRVPWRGPAIMGSLLALSAVLLGFYNLYAYSNLTGPYEDGALQLNPTSLMVGVGLLLDQNQGMLLLNPILWLGIAGLGFVARKNFALGILMTVLFLSLLVPNALHVVLYGGGSYSGRFGWTASVVMMVAALAGFAGLWKVSRGLTLGVTAAGLALQAWMFYIYVVRDTPLYRVSEDAWLSGYSLFYYPLQDWLPALYNVDWAYGYAPNYAWLMILLVLLVTSFVGWRMTTRGARIGAFAVALGAVVVGRLLGGADSSPRTYLAADHPAPETRAVGDSLIFDAPLGDVVPVAVTDLLPMRDGDIDVTFVYSGLAAGRTAQWELYAFESSTVIDTGTLDEPGDATQTEALHIEAKSFGRYQIRVRWSGPGTFTLTSVQFAQAGTAPAGAR